MLTKYNAKSAFTYIDKISYNVLIKSQISLYFIKDPFVPWSILERFSFADKWNHKESKRLIQSFCQWKNEACSCNILTSIDIISTKMDYKWRPCWPIGKVLVQFHCIMAISTVDINKLLQRPFCTYVYLSVYFLHWTFHVYTKIW